MLVYEEPDYIHIDDIGNIENSPRPVFIDEESGNPYQPKEEVKRFTIAYRCLLNENVIGESIYSVAMWNTYFFNYRIK